AEVSAAEWWAEVSAAPLSAAEWWAGVFAAPLSAVEWWGGGFAVPLFAGGSSGDAALRSGPGLSPACLGVCLPGAIWSTSAALPSRRCHLASALVSMAARVGVGNRPRGAGSGSGPVTTTTVTTDTTKQAELDS